MIQKTVSQKFVRRMIELQGQTYLKAGDIVEIKNQTKGGVLLYCKDRKTSLIVSNDMLNLLL